MGVDMLELQNGYMLNGDCLELMKDIADKSIDYVITSPPYNLNVKRKSGDMYNKKYISHQDHMSNDSYIEWQISIFKELCRILSTDGVILYNINYGGENNETLWLLLARLIENTDFTIADQIVWKKQVAIPNNRSKNKLTRICENVFVIVRKQEYMTFNTNKKVKSIVERTGQANYENVYNFIEAPNNNKGDHTKLHKATYSIELVQNLIDIYVKENSLVLDPFSGSGTTAIACINTNRNYICIEKDETYFNKSVERINNHVRTAKWLHVKR